MFLLSINSTVNADFWSPTSINLYKNIDAWYKNMQDRMETFELEWWQKKEWILTSINKYAILNQIPACLDESKNLSAEEFKTITKNQEVGKFITYLKKDCLLDYAKGSFLEKNTNASSALKTKIKNSSKLNSKWNKIYWTELIIKYMALLTQYEKEKKQLASIKSTQIYKISKIWLYSDWDIDNSGFDLIYDIQEIDKIIFASVEDYTWEPNQWIDDALNWFLKPVIDTVNKLSSPDFWNNEDEEIVNNKQITPTPQIIKTENIDNVITTTNNYLCLSGSENSWLSTNTINSLVTDIQNNINTNNTNPNLDQNTNSNNNTTDDWGWDITPWSSLNTPNWSYEKVRDNSEWPCESFFCINIDFTTYEHSLFWWWENITIEYLLNRSNKHLSKHAATSLIPAKMWTNEFELWLKDLNLPDIFHLSIQISTKPIPILNIEDKSKKDETEYSSENMMKEYYASYWLNYNRRNDLVLLNKIEQNKQNTGNSTWLTPEKLLEKQYENDKIAEERQRKIATLENAIYSKVSYWPIWTFEEQFTELDKFTFWINEYVNTLYSLIKKLKEIPIEY